MSGIGTIPYIKISRTDGNGIDVTNSLAALSNIVLPLSTGNKEFKILNRTKEAEYFLFYVSTTGRENIPASDKSSPNYSFSGSYSGFISNFKGTPPITVSVDIQNFFLEGSTTTTGTGLGVGIGPIDSYRITTLPAKNIGIHVSSSFNVLIPAAGKFGDTGITASLRILTNPLTPGLVPPNPTVLTTSVITQSFQDLSTVDFIFSGSYEAFASISASQFTPGDCIYFDINFLTDQFGDVLPSSATFHNGIFEISSSNAVVNPKELSIEPYFTSPFYGTDCDVMYGSISRNRSNPFLQDLDYQTSQTTPINLEAVISESATKATVPESMFTITSLINPGHSSINQSKDINKYTPGFSIGTYGKTSPIDSLDTNIYEFEWGGGTTPEILGYGSFKMGRILQVQSTESAKIINASDGLTSQVQAFPFYKSIATISAFRKLVGINAPAGVSPNNATGSLPDGKRFCTISQSIGDYYYNLNFNNPVNTEITPFMYPNVTAGSNPVIPKSTKILTTEFGVPTISSYALTSSNSTVYGTLNNSGGGFGFIQLDRDVEISKIITDSNGFYQSGKPIKPNWAKIGDQIVENLNNNERWFVTIYNEFEFPNGLGDYNSVLTTGSLSPYNTGYNTLDANGNYPNPLPFKGVYEILGVFDNFAVGEFQILLKYPISGGPKNIGGATAGNSLGMLMWKARASNKTEFVIVQDEITGGITAGAFTNKFAPQEVIDNFDTITRDFGSNTT